MPRPLYVETHIRADRDVLWRRTQDPAEHQRWDLRFTTIDYAPPQPGRPQAFSYGFRIPWRTVSGVGVSVGESARGDGQLTSALLFRSDDRLSPLRTGQGWWRYVPDDSGFRFLTGYDYDVRWGAAGRVIDRWAFRPWMGWATAWSFDRLRLWCEHDVSPEHSRNVAALDAAARVATAVAIAAVVRRSRTRSHLRAAAGALAGVVLVPRSRVVPRAGRCLRSPPDDLGRRAPAVSRTFELP